MFRNIFNTNWLIYKFVGFIGILLGGWGFFSSLLSEEYTLHLPVKQKLSIQEPQALLRFNKATLITQETVLEIKNPSIVQRLLWPNLNAFEPLVWLVVCIAGITTLKLFIGIGNTLEVYESNLKWLKLLWGSCFVCFFVFHISSYFIYTQVEALTNGQIEFNRYGNNHSSDIVWIGILFGLLHRFYEKAVELKKSMG